VGPTTDQGPGTSRTSHPRSRQIKAARS
jgi:hypothetical protein